MSRFPSYYGSYRSQQPTFRLSDESKAKLAEAAEAGVRRVEWDSYWSDDEGHTYADVIALEEGRYPDPPKDPNLPAWDYRQPRNEPKIAATNLGHDLCYSLSEDLGYDTHGRFVLDLVAKTVSCVGDANCSGSESEYDDEGGYYTVHRDGYADAKFTYTLNF